MMLDPDKKRLTRKQAKALIELEGELDTALTAKFREERNGWVSEPKIYKLPENRYLYVFDEKDISLPGKGNIYTAEEMQRTIEWREDVFMAIDRGGGNSVEDWRYYSKLETQLIHHIEQLIKELSRTAEIKASRLDRSYKSLNLVSEYLIKIGYKRARGELFDHLVAYVGEVLRHRSEGKWHIINRTSGEPDYPCIIGPTGNGVMIPINAVWIALDAYGKCQLRQPTINEYRNYCVRNI
ncbi:MAG: hypothetical protein WA885_18825 [Phormidesmis sp.]